MEEKFKKGLIATTGILILLNFFVIPKDFVNFVWMIICGLVAVESYLDYRSDGKRLNLYVTIFFVIATITWLFMTLFPR